MQALQRVQSSRSIGFSWRHSTSNAPSQPDTRSGLPDQIGTLRSAGSSPPSWPVISTLVFRFWFSFNFKHQKRAAEEGAISSNSRPDLYSTVGPGCGSGSAAAASSAAIFGVAALPSADQPAASRMFTKRNSAVEPALCASSLKSGASWVQATSSSASPSEPCRRAASLRHSSVCTVSGASDFNAAASAAASSAIVLLQLQSFRVLCWIDIVARAVVLRAIVVCTIVVCTPGGSFDL